MKRFVITGTLLIGVPWIAGACSGSAASSASGPLSTTPTVGSGGGTVSVALDQWSVTPTTTTVPAGKVNIKVSNDGTIAHELVVLQTDTLATDVSITSFEGEKDRINEDTSGTNVGETGDLQPGGTKTITLTLQPGHYVLLCNLPAHYGLGMHTDVTVAAA